MTKKTTAPKATKAATKPAAAPTRKTAAAADAKPVKAATAKAASPAAPTTKAAPTKAAPTKAATAVVATPVAAPAPLPPIAHAEFEAIVRAEAHAFALARGFRDGSPFADWVRAEAAVLARLAAEGRTVAPPAPAR